MADLDNLIDSKISLISHQDVRYDGTLFSINTSESSIVLKDVKCLGTEGRVTDEAKKIPSNPTVIPFVTFPGAEIKDLYVHESPEPSLPTPQPAPRKTENRPNNNYKQQNAPKPQQNSYDQHDNRNRRQPQQQQHQQQAPRQQQSQAPQKREQPPRQHEPRVASNAGTGAHLLHLREKRGDGAAADKQDNSSVFDFEAGLNIFKKDEVLAKVATEDNSAVVKEVKYKKDDFFDMLSTDRAAREEGQPQQARMTASQERSLNQDTFGAIALQGGGGQYRRQYGRGNGSGRGNSSYGGGRGSGRGRGRGRQSAAAN